MEYLISTYQVIYADGSRDTVKPVKQILTDDINAIRNLLKVKHECACVNLTYSELTDKEGK